MDEETEVTNAVANGAADAPANGADAPPGIVEQLGALSESGGDMGSCSRS